MSIEPDVSMTNVIAAAGRSVSGAVPMPTRTRRVPSVACGASPVSTVTPSAPSVGAGSP